MGQIKKSLRFSPLIFVFILTLAGCSAALQYEPAAELLEQVNLPSFGGFADGIIGEDSLPPAMMPRIAAAEDGSLEQIYAAVNPSVVHIQVVQSATALPSDHPTLPGGPDSPAPLEPPQALGEGSGFVWDRKGHIVTNNHVVADADKITVVFADDSSVTAELVGADPDSDLAVLKVDVPAGELRPVTLGDSTTLQVGQLAIAIGNPFGQEGTMTVGVISALGRLLPVDNNNPLAPRFNIPDVIQTDAAINPGNSGGVLLNGQGEVVGVTTAIISPFGASAGIGFAIPSATVEQIVPALIADGKYDHPFLGISGTSLTSELADEMGLDADQRGVLVINVIPDGPAEKAGLQGSEKQVEIDGRQALVGGDVITALDGQTVQDMDDLIAQLERSTRVGQRSELSILRQGQSETVKVTIGARPDREAPVTPSAHQESQGSEEEEPAAWLGILGMPLIEEVAEAMGLDADQEGLMVVQIEHGSPADDAGVRGSYKLLKVEGQRVLMGGDVIVSIGDEKISDPQVFRTVLSELRPGDEIELTLLRDGEQEEVGVTLGERPSS